MHETTLGEALRRCGGSIKTGPFGTMLKAAEYAEAGSPVISVGEIGDGTLRIHSRTPRVAPGTTKRLSEYVLRSEDIVFARKGAVDRSAFVQQHEEGYFLGSDAIRVRCGPTLHARFVAFQMRTQRVRAWLTQHAAGTTMLSLNQPTLERVPLRVPDLPIQEAIARVLGALDDKIAANTATVNLVAALAQALVQGASAGCSPVGLSSIIRLITRGITPQYTIGEGWTVLNQKCVRDHQVSLVPARVMEPKPSAVDRLLRPHDFLVNSTGQGTLGRTARWTTETESVTVDSHITIVRFDEQQVDPAFAGIAALPLDSHIELLAEGSTGQTELRRDLLGALTLRLPDLVTQTRVGGQIRQQDAIVSALRLESARLAAARDELLPLLMSGRLSVRDAERTTENVT